MLPTIHRSGDDGAAWSRALDAALAHFDPLIRQVGAPDVSVAPTIDPAGDRLPYLVDVAYGDQLGRVLVADGRVVPAGGGAPAASATFARIGFPKTRLSRELVAEILGYHQVVDREALPYPLWDWPDLDEPFQVAGNAPPRLTFDGGGACLVTQRTVTVGDRVTEDREVEVRIAPDGRVAVERFVGFGDARRPAADPG